jgi:hypothetical protein
MNEVLINSSKHNVMNVRYLDSIYIGTKALLFPKPRLSLSVGTCVAEKSFCLKSSESPID